MRKVLISSVLLSVGMLSACGGNGGSPVAPTPTPTAPAANHNPVIASVTVNPAFGIADLQSFNFAAVASDPDGDSITYKWDAAGNAGTGAAPPPIVFVSPGGLGRATVTVSDGRGGSATSSVNFTVGSMSGAWVIDAGPLVGSSFQLTQSGAIVSGTFTLPGIGTGNTDPAEPGQITVAGNLTMRVKVGRFTDFRMEGNMDSTGTRVTGNLQGSGFTGQPFSMHK